ncbi:hypothetical protein FNT36_08870 [Hymenobacter setariae]|uniref:LTD domain-containing protein n=1 Tax=Hymenobacter setariae TaxID=2594794 RepID=A0A558BYE4_9BACT|nr:lamin tail domain-containing protein [Hymenobacter setariae]TVT41540.1 hypothetical protein FNT36_08870 [Hymenobacter setariae]
MKYILLLFFMLPLAAFAQLAETFADGNFTQNPAWNGDAASFIVANQVLQSNGPATTGTQLQLVTPCQASTGATWEFWANLKLATSSGNLADVWLLASQADLKSAATKGYFVRLGGTDDEVSLFRKDSAKAAVMVIDGQNGTLGTSNNVVRVRVTRSLQGQWKLERDLSGGRSFVAEASQPIDNTHQRSAVIGVSLVYSAANSKNFYFDDFSVTDATAPLLTRAAPLDARTVEVVFNEAVDPTTAIQLATYRLATGVVPTSAQVSALNPAVVRLTFGQDFASTNTLEVRQLADLYGNVAAGPLTATFGGVAVAPRIGELLITEIMARETPAVGLPASEFVEIYNNTAAKILSLRGVRLLKSGSATAAVLPDTARLLPGQYAVVCGATRAAQFATYGKVYGVSNFPTLTNAGDQLVLRGRDGTTLFEVAYTDDWYRDQRKKNGGWTLEMRDPSAYCSGADNWQASQDTNGGTPARRNSVATASPDRTPPTLLRAVALTASTVRLYFGEKLDSAAAASPALYTLQSNAGTPLGVRQAAPMGPDFRAVDLLLGTTLQPSQPITVAVARATDCAGNASGALTYAGFALTEAAQPGDLVVNEVLFNHRSGGVYFVELLNRSARYLNLQGYQLATQKATGLGTCAISPTAAYVLAPGQLVALTSDADILQVQYPTSNDAAALLAVAGFPALDTSTGSVYVYDAGSQELDHYVYDKSQQLSLLSTAAGVSLERIRAAGPSLASNFHSAASTVGYATPGRPNSQAQDAAGGGQELALAPELFTPDNDGQQDFTTLSYELGQPGYVGSVTVYDALGRLTRRLLRNESLPTTGAVQWDGTDDNGHKAAVGYYIVHVELFRPSGAERREYKKTVVVGARL